MADRGDIDSILSQYGPEPQPLGGPPQLPNVLPREMRTPQLGQGNLVDRALSSFGQPSLDALRQGYAGEATPQEIARTFLETGPMGPFGMARAPARVPNPIRAYHGSPHDFDEFVTPAFFSPSERIAQFYRRDGGGQDNLNRLGGYDAPEGWYRAHDALDRAGQDRAGAIARIEQDTREFAELSQFWQQPTWLGRLMGRPARMTPEGEQTLRDLTARNQAGIDYLQSGSPLGRVYEVELPAPTAHYGLGFGGENQAADIADAVAKGHKVIRWGGSPGRADSGEIIALSPEIIEILRKYGIAAPVAGVTTADILSQYDPDQDR